MSKENMVTPVVKKTEVTFGQERPMKGVEPVTPYILGQLKDLADKPNLGPTAEGLKELIKYVEGRQLHGIQKYGTTLETWNGRDPLIDVLEEEVDRFQYLVQARKERADLLEMVGELKRKNLKLEKDLDEANHAISVLQRSQSAPPSAGTGSTENAPQGPSTGTKEAILGVLCTTGQLPPNRVPDVKDILSDLFLACYANAALHGFWGPGAELAIKQRQISAKEFSCIPEKLCLIHSEVSEALEVFRSKERQQINGDWLYWVTSTGKAEGFVSELADVLIRIGDLIGAFHLEKEFVDATIQKMKYNAGRPHMHGKAC